jgi:HEAT repeat protein
MGEESSRRELEGIYDELNDPAVVEQLIQSVANGSIQPEPSELALFFSHLRPQTLPLLVEAAETTAVPMVRKQLTTAVARLGRSYPEQLMSLLESENPTLTAGAAKAVENIGLSAATGRIIALLQRPYAEVRRVAVETLVNLKNEQALAAVAQALDDEDRQVRVAAARGLGASGSDKALKQLEARLDSRELRDADITEQIAVFEAYGALGGEAAVPVLDNLLNGRSLLRRKKPSELRACAALALGRIGSQTARAALKRASDESDPVVRSAVMRALRQEEPAS